MINMEDTHKLGASAHAADWKQIMTKPSHETHISMKHKLHLMWKKREREGTNRNVEPALKVS